LDVVTDPELRALLTSGIRTLVERAVIQQLVVSLGDTHEQVRIAAAAQLVRCGGHSAIAVVIDRQKEDPIPGVRASLVRLVASTLTPGQPGSEKEIEFLADRIRDPDSNVSVNAMESLGAVTGIGREFDNDWWRRWWEHRLLEKRDVRPETSPAPPPGGETPPRMGR
jgi:HEAT repeat protein